MYKTTANFKKSSIFVQKLCMETKIKTLFNRNKGYIKRQQIPDRATYYQILKLIKSGKIERVKPGIYHYNTNSPNPIMIDIGKIVPNGVLCMYSTWLHYELSVQIPQCFNIAIEKSRKIILPDYPPIKLYFWKQEYYELGIDTQIINGYSVKIYDLEKSVCDAVKFRNKIGMETTAEIIRNYLNRKERNFTKLMHYAETMRISKIMRTYIEIQL
jgi:predicted transcriptional regulator of viral defense system